MSRSLHDLISCRSNKAWASLKGPAHITGAFLVSAQLHRNLFTNLPLLSIRAVFAPKCGHQQVLHPLPSFSLGITGPGSPLSRLSSEGPVLGNEPFPLCTPANATRCVRAWLQRTSAPAVFVSDLEIGVPRTTTWTNRGKSLLLSGLSRLGDANRALFGCSDSPPLLRLLVPVVCRLIEFAACICF